MTYEKFIQNILDTRGRFGISDDEYKERHHIQLESLGGLTIKENLIDLYAREHFIAHKLLYEENPHNSKITYAYWMMAHGCRTKDQDRYECTPEEYEDAKIAFVNICKQRVMSDAQREHIRARRLGSKASDETKIKMSIMKRGEMHPLFGAHLSEETKKKIGDANTGHFHTEEYKKEKSKQNSGKNNPNYGNLWDDQQKRQQSERMSGENNPNYGTHRTEETKKKISQANKGKPKSDAQRKKQSEAMTGKLVGAQSPNHVPIFCPELNEEFWGARDVYNKYGVAVSGICSVLKGRRKSAGKHPVTGEPLTWVKLEK